MSPSVPLPVMAGTIPHRPPGLPLRVPRGLLEGTGVAPTDPHWDAGEGVFHLAPRSGWGSDPHGPIYWRGRYHLFYQSTPGTCQWYWGLRWDHAVSDDLVTWTRLPPAITPTPGGLDADGCFTGNIQVHPATGVPMLFYTGARLRHNPMLTMPDPPLDACNPLMFHWETQLCAVADPDDELMVKWTKVATPWMELPHCAYLSAWRDPFFVPPRLDPVTGQPASQLPPATPAATAVTSGNRFESSGAVTAAGPSPATATPDSATGCSNGTLPGSAVTVTDSSGSSGGGCSSSVGEVTSGTATTHINSQGADAHGTAAKATIAAAHADTGASGIDVGGNWELLDTTGAPSDTPSSGVNGSSGSSAACIGSSGSSGSDSHAPGLLRVQEDEEGYMMLIGSGLEGLGGTALIYRSQDLARGWRFAGYLCTWPNLQTGLCWECPHLLHLPDLPPGLTCMAPTATLLPHPAAAAAVAAVAVAGATASATASGIPVPVSAATGRTAEELAAAYARTKELAEQAWAAHAAAAAAATAPAVSPPPPLTAAPPVSSPSSTSPPSLPHSVTPASVEDRSAAAPEEPLPAPTSPSSPLQPARSLAPDHTPIVLPVRSQSLNVIYASPGRCHSAPDVHNVLPNQATAGGLSYSAPRGMPDEDSSPRLPGMRAASEDNPTYDSSDGLLPASDSDEGAGGAPSSSHTGLSGAVDAAPESPPAALAGIPADAAAARTAFGGEEVMNEHGRAQAAAAPATGVPAAAAVGYLPPLASLLIAREAPGRPFTPPPAPDTPTRSDSMTDSSSLNVQSPFAHVAAAAAVLAASAPNTPRVDGEHETTGAALEELAVVEEEVPFFEIAAATASVEPPAALQAAIAGAPRTVMGSSDVPHPAEAAAGAQERAREHTMLHNNTAGAGHASSAPAVLVSSDLPSAATPSSQAATSPLHSSASASVAVSPEATSAATAALAPQLLQRARTAGAVASAVSVAAAALAGAGGSAGLGTAASPVEGCMERILEGAEGEEDEEDGRYEHASVDGLKGGYGAVASPVPPTLPNLTTPQPSCTSSGTMGSSSAAPSPSSQLHSSSTEQLVQQLMGPHVRTPASVAPPAVPAFSQAHPSVSPVTGPGIATGAAPAVSRRSSITGAQQGLGPGGIRGQEPKGLEMAGSVGSAAAAATPQEQLMASIMQGRQAGAAAAVAAGTDAGAAAGAGAPPADVAAAVVERKRSFSTQVDAGAGLVGSGAAGGPASLSSGAAGFAAASEGLSPAITPPAASAASSAATAAALPAGTPLTAAPPGLLHQLTPSSLLDLGTAVEAAAAAVADAAATLDIKAATEAGMAGLGHASVLTMHAPHDIAQLSIRQAAMLPPGVAEASTAPAPSTDGTAAAAGAPLASAPAPAMLPLADYVVAAAGAAASSAVEGAPGQPLADAASQILPAATDDSSLGAATAVAVEAAPLPASVNNLMGGLARDAAAAEVGAALASVFAAGAEQAAVAAAGSTGTPASLLLAAATALPMSAAGQQSLRSVGALSVSGSFKGLLAEREGAAQPDQQQQLSGAAAAAEGAGKAQPSVAGSPAVIGSLPVAGVQDAGGVRRLVGEQEMARVSAGLEPAGPEEGAGGGGGGLPGATAATAGAETAAAPGGVAGGGADGGAAKRVLPTPPAATRSPALDINQVRAACRAYAEAAAAVQGFDLGLPPADAEVVRRVACGPPAVPEPAHPDQRWFLGFAPDAATYGIVYFLGNYARDRFHLEDAQGPYKLDLGNVLYAPLAFYDQRAGRHLVWGYLKELRTLPPPPSMCNKYVSSGCVSLPRALYLRGGRLFQVPLPEMALLRQPGALWAAPPGPLSSTAGPLHVPGPESGGVGGDHLDMELVVRRGSAARTVLLLDSWRVGRQGAAAAVYHWATRRLEVVYNPRLPRHATRVWGAPAAAASLPKLNGSTTRASAASGNGQKKSGSVTGGVLGEGEAGGGVPVGGSGVDEDPGEGEAVREEEEEEEAEAGSVKHHPGVGLPGGHHTVDDEDGAEYQLYVDPKVPPVPDMNPDVPEWLRMRRHVAGGVLDVGQQPGGADELALRVFVDGSAVEIFTGTGQALSTRVYRGNPRLADVIGTPETAMDRSVPVDRSSSVPRSPPGHMDRSDATTTPVRSDPSAAAAKGGPAVSLWAVGGACEVVRWEVHAVRSAWLRGDADAPLPAPVTKEAMERWVAEGLYKPPS